MTPTQLDHLNLIKTHLETLLANAEKRTPGKWESEPQFKNEIWCDSEYICDCVDSAEPNAVFIVSCAGNAEAGWRSTLSALEVVLNCNENSFPHMYAAVQVAQMADSILTTWPLKSLNP